MKSIVTASNLALGALLEYQSLLSRGQGQIEVREFIIRNGDKIKNARYNKEAVRCGTLEQRNARAEHRSLTLEQRNAKSAAAPPRSRWRLLCSLLEPVTSQSGGCRPFAYLGVSC